MVPVKIVPTIKELKMPTQAVVQILVYSLKHCNEMEHVKIVLRIIELLTTVCPVYPLAVMLMKLLLAQWRRC